MGEDSVGFGDVVLEAQGLSKSFRGLKAVEEYSVRLSRGEILGIIGPNGAGKSTVFNLLTGHIKPTRGRMVFEGVDISRASPEKIAALGMGRTFQNIRLFGSMSVLGNVVAAEQMRGREAFVSAMLGLRAFRAEERRCEEAAMEALKLFDLEDKAGESALSLPYGDQRRLEIVRALALKPRLLLLDEPTAGMNPHESAELLDLVRRIRSEYDLTIILVEHNMPLVMRLCSRLQVLNYGKIIAEGKPEDVRSDKRVIESYLGKTG